MSVEKKSREEYLNIKYGEATAVYRMVNKLGEESQPALGRMRVEEMAMDEHAEIRSGFSDIALECAKLLDTLFDLKQGESS